MKSVVAGTTLAKLLLNVVAMHRHAKPKGAMGHIELQLKGTAVGLSRLEGKGSKTQALSRGIEDFVIGFVHEPDHDSHFSMGSRAVTSTSTQAVSPDSKVACSPSLVAHGNLRDRNRAFAPSGSRTLRAAQVAAHHVIRWALSDYLAVFQHIARSGKFR